MVLIIYRNLNEKIFYDSKYWATKGQKENTICYKCSRLEISSKGEIDFLNSFDIEERQKSIGNYLVDGIKGNTIYQVCLVIFTEILNFIILLKLILLVKTHSIFMTQQSIDLKIYNQLDILSNIFGRCRWENPKKDKSLDAFGSKII